MGNPFVHVELHANDLPAAKAFYSELFDWQLQEVPEMDYTLVQVGDGTGGGMTTNQHPGAPSFWLAVVGVEDIQASSAKAKELGANLFIEGMEVGDMGWFSLFQDPQGAMLSIWQDNPSASRM